MWKRIICFSFLTDKSQWFYHKEDTRKKRMRTIKARRGRTGQFYDNYIMEIFWKIEILWNAEREVSARVHWKPQQHSQTLFGEGATLSMPDIITSTRNGQAPSMIP